jgi:YD repeat-containing protein
MSFKEQCKEQTGLMAKWHGLVLLMLTFAAMSLCSSTPAQARNLEANVFYLNDGNYSSWDPLWGNYVLTFNGTTRQIPFDTPDEAYAYVIAHTVGPISFLDLFPEPGTLIINGKYPLYYDWHYIHTYNPPGYWTGQDLIADEECTTSASYPIFSTPPDATTWISYFCAIPTAVQQQQANQPDCDLCNQKNPPPIAGNPILPSTGIKQQIETDYQGDRSNSLQFIRTYRSDRNGWANNYQLSGVDFASAAQAGYPDTTPCLNSYGSVTRRVHCYKFTSTGLPNDFVVQRGNGRMMSFGTATDLSTTPDINDRVTKVVDGNGTTIGWAVYNAANDSNERYDLAGHILTVTERNGQVTTFTYSDSTTLPTIAPKTGLLIRVTDAFGHTLNFTYDSASRLATMTDPNGGITTYAYDESSSIVLSGVAPAGNLTSVTYPDGKKRIYWYNEQDKTANTNLPFALTGITDENGIRFATWYYDTQGRAISSEHAGSVEKYTVTYPQQYAQSVVTDPLGATHTYHFQNILGVVKKTGETQSAGTGSAAASTMITYDANGNVASKTDFNGNKTTYTYDLSRNLETSRVEASGTPQARTISTQWHPTYRLPIAIAEPLRLTTFNYDTNGNLLNKTIQATTDANGSQGFNAQVAGTPRTWSYTYNQYGQVLTAKGPRTDINDTTTYTYDPVTSNLLTITNAAGQVTTLSNYDANGRVGTITDPNGIVTNLAYYPRGWLQSKSVHSADGSATQTTTYNYDGVGQLKNVTLPDNSTINYTYDDAHRLTDIADSLGNTIHYVLDAMGNRTDEQVKDTNGTLTRHISRLYDALNRLQQVTGGVQ